MRVLVACERSGIIRDQFILKGHQAISCDLHPSRRPGPHWQGDVREILSEPWDLLIAHPVCRYMANSGVRWLHERPERWALMVEGCEFFKLFERANHIPKRCIENPIMHKYALSLVGRRADQFVHPHFHGDPFSKATGLWLTGLPLLKRTHWIERADIRQACWLEPPGADREERRSETYPAIAHAMAEQWG